MSEWSELLNEIDAYLYKHEDVLYQGSGGEIPNTAMRLRHQLSELRRTHPLPDDTPERAKPEPNGSCPARAPYVGAHVIPQGKKRCIECGAVAHGTGEGE